MKLQDTSNPYQPPKKDFRNLGSKLLSKNWRSRLYGLIVAVGWGWAILVALFLIIMFVEYRKPGAGAASPFGVIPLTYLVINTTVWMVPTIVLLTVIHNNRFRRMVTGR